MLVFKTDKFFNKHVVFLYTELLEQNLKKIVMPYSNVEVSHVASLIGLPEQTVWEKYQFWIINSLISFLDSRL